MSYKFKNLDKSYNHLARCQMLATIIKYFERQHAVKEIFRIRMARMKLFSG
jgi:hypothetical protein